MTEMTELLEHAEKLKEEGNQHLAQHKYGLAAEKYTAAIELNGTSAIYYSNRAQALIKLESYGLAIQDANEAIKIDPKYIKALYRRASANYALGKLKEALRDFKMVVQIKPKDPDAVQKMKACEKRIREDAFAKAMEFDGPDSSALAIDIASIVVEASYDGPRLPDPVAINAEKTDGNDGSGSTNSGLVVSMQFVHDTIAHFKNQKVTFPLSFLCDMVSSSMISSHMTGILATPHLTCCLFSCSIVLLIFFLFDSCCIVNMYCKYCKQFEIISRHCRH